MKSNITDNESGKMTTSKGTIQGYNGVATVDKKPQIIIDAQAFGEGQEHHTLKPVLETVQQRYKKLGIADNIYQTGAIVTADTGFANEANMQYLHEHQINGYIPDNRFRSRDPKFADQKEKYGKLQKTPSKSDWKHVIPASEFQFDPVTMTCICPAGESLLQFLAPGGFGVGVVGRAHHGHKDLCLVDLSGGAVNDGDGLAGIVHEQLLTGPVVLAHHHVQLAPPGPVVLAEPAVLIPIRISLPVLLPEQEQGDVLALEFITDVLPVGYTSGLCREIR